MTPNQLEFLGSSAVLTTSWVVFGAGVLLCIWSWARSGRTPSMGGVEALRLLIISAILVSLNQPEWVVQESETDTPELLILWDDSESMQTCDILNDLDPGASPRSRRVAALEWASPDAWREIEDRYRVIIKAFDGPPATTDPVTATEENSVRGGPSTNIQGPLGDALKANPKLRAAVVISDGDWNKGRSPTDAAMDYRAAGVPIFTRSVGSQIALPDLSLLSIDAPKFAIQGKSLEIPFSVRSTMPRDCELTATLEIEGGEILTQGVHIKARSLFTGGFTWTPRTAGKTILSLSLPVESGELNSANNQIAASIEVRKESLRVLLVDSYPRWEYRYLRNALVRDEGVEVTCLLFHPDLRKNGGGPYYIKAFPSKRELSSFDVVFLGDVGARKGQLSNDDCDLIKGLVEQQASGLILMPGLRGYQESLFASSLGSLFPVLPNAALPMGIGSPTLGEFALTEAGRESLLTRLSGDPRENSRLWEGFPGFNWHAGALRARPGSKVLAVHRIERNEFGRFPLLVSRVAGAGKVLYMGTDSIWKWRQGVEDRYHYRFWAQVSRWMAYQRKMAGGDLMRVFYQPDRPSVGERITLSANVMDGTGEPIETGTVTLTVTDPTGERKVERMNTASGGEWGLYKGGFLPTRPGEHEISLFCRETGKTVNTIIPVQGTYGEQRGQPARPDVLAEVSAVSRGMSLGADGLRGIIAGLRALPSPPPVTSRTKLWATPMWGALIIILMTTFWVARKWVGRI